VGVYPQGVNKWGVHDGAGNVWEWTRSLYQPYPYVAEDGCEDQGAEGNRVLRGGSWDFDRGYARCAYRYGLVPDLFDYNLGFRVVVSLVRG
jgi:formylglycine-generating enzyme required for sulfatase activity